MTGVSREKDLSIGWDGMGCLDRLLIAPVSWEPEGPSQPLKSWWELETGNWERLL